MLDIDTDLGQKIADYARRAAGIDKRINGEDFTTLTLLADETGWYLVEGILRRADGREIYTDLLTPVDERMPASIKKQALERRRAAEELADLLAELPYSGQDLEIPLQAA